MASRRSGVANAGRNLDAGRPAVSRLLAVAEAYPDLKTDANFAKLFDELKDTEDRIALAREFYNDSLKTLRDRLQTFPDLLVAKVFRFKAGRYLPAVHEEPEIRTPPDVS